ALGERGHGGLAWRRIAVRWRAACMVRKYQRPHPGRSYGRGTHLEDAADHNALCKHVVVVIAPSAGRPAPYSRRSLAQSRTELRPDRGCFSCRRKKRPSRPAIKKTV